MYVRTYVHTLIVELRTDCVGITEASRLLLLFSQPKHQGIVSSAFRACVT